MKDDPVHRPKNLLIYELKVLEVCDRNKNKSKQQGRRGDVVLVMLREDEVSQGESGMDG